MRLFGSCLAEKMRAEDPGGRAGRAGGLCGSSPPRGSGTPPGDLDHLRLQGGLKLQKFEAQNRMVKRKTGIFFELPNGLLVTLGNFGFLQEQLGGSYKQHML